jgi:hypothetical protein
MIVSFDKKSNEIEICEKTDFTSNAILVEIAFYTISHPTPDPVLDLRR